MTGELRAAIWCDAIISPNVYTIVGRKTSFPIKCGRPYEEPGLNLHQLRTQAAMTGWWWHPSDPEADYCPDHRDETSTWKRVTDDVA